MNVQSGLSMMLTQDFQTVVEPLFREGIVDCLEWTFDMGWGRELSAWLLTTLQQYSECDRLLGHGVSYSALDASEGLRQPMWLDRLRQELVERRYAHVSEHFGCMGGGNFHMAAPMPVPMTTLAIEVGQQRLQQLASVANVPIGLENLAFAFHRKDVQQQGEFLERLLDPVDGFLLLDLHNLYCQACNFEVPIMDLAKSYPLQRVRELHLSGGSWSRSTVESNNDNRQIRRDTHDDHVPEQLFEILPEVMSLCPNLKVVILERMDDTIDVADANSVSSFREEFRRLRRTVQDAAQ